MKRKIVTSQTPLGRRNINNTPLGEFLRESNLIESEKSSIAITDAIAAWQYLKSRHIVTPEVILEVHRLLGKHIAPQIAGKWRNCDVWIGGQKKWFISEALIKEQVPTLCASIKESIKAASKYTSEEHDETCKRMHILFEDIHPFVDINGRTGRHIWQWHRLHMGLPIKVIHADYPKEGGECDTYYKWFRE